MREFDGVYIPEIGDLAYRTYGDITKYFVILGSNSKGVTYAFQIYLCDYSTNKVLVDAILKKSIDYYFSQPVILRMTMPILYEIPSSAAYNKYKGLSFHFYYSIGKDNVTKWLLKSKLQGVDFQEDISYSLCDLLVENRENALRSIELNDSIQLVKRNVNTYALLLGKSMDKDLYVKFSVTERLLENPSQSVKDRFMKPVRLKCSNICKTGERIELDDEAKAIVKDYMRKLLKYDV